MTNQRKSPIQTSIDKMIAAHLRVREKSQALRVAIEEEEENESPPPPPVEPEDR